MYSQARPGNRVIANVQLKKNPTLRKAITAINGGNY